jgi:membrane protein
MGRAYRIGVRADATHRPATAAFGAAPSGAEPRAAQHARAQEPERGRQASSPSQIPFTGWKDILWRTYARIGEDRLLAVAAGVVFYGLLALFPAITAVVSLYGLFAKPRQSMTNYRQPADSCRARVEHRPGSD